MLDRETKTLVKKVKGVIDSSITQLIKISKQLRLTMADRKASDEDVLELFRELYQDEHIIALIEIAKQLKKSDVEVQVNNFICTLLIKKEGKK